jgi:hypothetical protein
MVLINNFHTETLDPQRRHSPSTAFFDQVARIALARPYSHLVTQCFCAMVGSPLPPQHRHFSFEKGLLSHKPAILKSWRQDCIPLLDKYRKRGASERKPSPLGMCMDESSSINDLVCSL